MALPDLTGQNIQDTYKRVLTVGNGGHMYDGTGSIFIPLSASVEVNYEVSSSYADSAASLVMEPSIAVTHITASGNISASGYITADYFRFSGPNEAGDHRFIVAPPWQETDADSILLGGDVRIDQKQAQTAAGITPQAGSNTGDLSVLGHVSASQLISNTWKIPEAGGATYLSYDTTTDQLEIGGAAQVGAYPTKGMIFFTSGSGVTGYNKIIFGDVGYIEADNYVSASEAIIQGHITASGNIKANGLNINGTTTFNDGNIIDVGNINLDSIQNEGENGTFLKMNPANISLDIAENPDVITFGPGGHITASGDVSSSANIYGKNIYTSNLFDSTKTYHLFTVDGTTLRIGQDSISSNISPVPLSVLSHITASGNISASTIHAFHVTSSGNISSSGEIISTGNITTDGILYTDDIRRLTDNSTSTRIQMSGNNISVYAGSSTNSQLNLNSSYGTVFNQGGEGAYDFRVEGDTATHLIFADAGTDKVGIKNSAPGVELDVIGTIAASTQISSSGGIVGTQIKASTGAIIGDESQGTSFLVNGPIQSMGVITASAGISASGDVIADGFVIQDTSANGVRIYESSNGVLQLGAGNGGGLTQVYAKSDTFVASRGSFTEITASSDIKVLGAIIGDITASANISASGNILATGNVDVNGFVEGIYHNATTSGTGYKLSGAKILYVDDTKYVFGRKADIVISGSTISLGNTGDVNTHVTASGNISASGTITAVSMSGDGSGLTNISATVPSGTVSGSGQIDHDSTTNFVANEHIDHTDVTMTAGDGLIGGGAIEASRTFSVNSASLAPFFSSSLNDFTTTGNISSSGGDIIGQNGYFSDDAGIYTNKVRRFSDSSTTTMIKLNDEHIKLYAGSNLAETIGVQHQAVKLSGSLHIESPAGGGHITASGNISTADSIYVDKIRRYTADGTTTKILLNSDVLKFHTGDSSIETLKIQTSSSLFTGHITASGNVQSNYIVAKTPMIQLNTTDNTTDMYQAYSGTTGGTTIEWDKQEIVDSKWFTHDPASNPDRITVVEEGRYEVSWTVVFNGDASADQRAMPAIKVFVNGAWETNKYLNNVGYLRRSAGINNVSNTGQYIIEVDAGDYIQLASGYQANFGAATGAPVELQRYNTTYGYSKLTIKKIG